MTQEAQLKACPFCGDKDDYNPSVSRLSKYAEPGDPEKGTTANLAAGLVDSDFYVECDKCGACGPPHETEGGAVELWNTRIESGVVAELVEALRFLGKYVYRRRQGYVLIPFAEQIAEVTAERALAMFDGHSDYADALGQQLEKLREASNTEIETMNAKLEASK